MQTFKIQMNADTREHRDNAQHLSVRLRAAEGTLNISLWQSKDEAYCTIVAFHSKYEPGRYLYNGPLDRLINVKIELLEQMMFEHAQKLLTGEVA